MREYKEIEVAVAGTCYVGLSIATLLAEHHHVTAVDVIPEKVDKINNHISPIPDEPEVCCIFMYISGIIVSFKLYNAPKSVNRSGIVCGQNCNTLTMTDWG